MQGSFTFSANFLLFIAGMASPWTQAPYMEKYGQESGIEYEAYVVEEKVEEEEEPLQDLYEPLRKEADYYYVPNSESGHESEESDEPNEETPETSEVQETLDDLSPRSDGSFDIYWESADENIQ